MTSQVKADLMLIPIALCWSFSYYLNSVCLREIGPFALNALRFIAAFAAAYAVAGPTLRKVSKRTLLYSVCIGTILSAIYIFATYGVKYTSVSNAGFLCTLAVVFTPICAFIFKKEIPGKKLVFVVIMCTISIALLTLNEELKPALGDVFCIISAAISAGHLLVTETAVRKDGVDAFHLGVYQLAVVGVLNALLAVAFETEYFPRTTAGWVSLIILAAFCTGFTLIALVIIQKYTTATHVGVILTLEPVFAGFVAYYFAGEILLPRAYAGAVMLIFGILIMEVDIKKLLKIESEERV